ncbi:MAG: hypothetical protein AAF447_25980 [Myxococcota bacterium]
MEEGERVFEALWAPRWFGQDQPVAHGQEALFHFRQVVPQPSGFVVMAAALDLPRYEARCRVLGLKHDVLGRLQAIELEGDTYRFVRHDGAVIVVQGAGQVVEGLAEAPPDWTMRVVFEHLER